MRRRQPPRQLQDRQRVATRLCHEPVADPLVEPAGDDGRKQGPRVLIREPAERQLRQAHQLTLVGLIADGEHERHRLGQQPPRDESEDLLRGDVEPLRVIDEAQQRPLRRDLGQQAERGQADQEAVGSRTRRQAQRHTQGRLLRLRKSAQPAEHRRAQLMQSRERQFHLGLTPAILATRKPDACRAQ